MATVATTRGRLKSMKGPFTYKRYRAKDRPNSKWVIEGWINGERKRVFRKSEGEASQLTHRRNMEASEFGNAAAMMPEEDRVMFRQCQDLLAAFEGATILDATKDYVTRLKQNARSCTIDKFCEEVIQQRKQCGYSARYICTLQVVARRLVRGFASKLVSEISTRDLDDFLGQLGVQSPVTRNHYRRIIVILFSYAKKAGYCSTNVAAATGSAKEIPRAPGILQPDELARLLAACCPQILAAVAIGAFAGLRTAELARLDWSEVKLEDGFIEVTAANAKSSRRRLVKILLCLDAWLRPLAKKAGRVMPFCENHYLALRAESERRADLSGRWPRNALRHSYASYHLAHFRNAAALALEMGHKSQNVIFSNYREVVRQTKADEYWRLAPFSRPELARIFAFTAEAYPWFREVAGAPDKDGCVSSVVDLAASLGVHRMTIHNWLSERSFGCPGETPDGSYHIPTWKKFIESRPRCGDQRWRTRPRATLPFYVRCPVVSANGKYLTIEPKYFRTLEEAEAWKSERNQRDLAREIHLDAINNVIELSDAIAQSKNGISEPRLADTGQ